MSATVIPYGYIELAAGNGEENYDWYGGQIETKRVFWGDWDKRLLFIEQYFVYVVGADGQIVSSNSSFYPDIPTLIPLRATIKGKLAASNEGTFGMISYQKALITLTYGIPPFGNNNGGVTQQNPNGDPFIPFAIEEGSSSVETQIINGPFFDETDSQIIPGLDEINILIAKEDITVTLPFVPEPNWDAYQSCIGKINTTNFYLPSGSYFTNAKVLYLGYQYNQKFLQDGTGVWEVRHKFSTRTNPRWDQKYIKNVTTGYPELILLPTDPGVFYSTDLNILLTNV